MRSGTFRLGALALLAAASAPADPVRNGNDAARYFAEADNGARTEVASRHVGRIHIFRYLEIIDISGTQTNAGPVRVRTREPGSGLRILLVAGGRASRLLAETLKPGDALAAKGRIKSMGGETVKNDMVVEPAVLQRKDRTLPKVGKELLREHR